MTSFLVCFVAWLVMSFAVARVSYRRARAKTLDTIEERMDSVTVATIRSQAHQDGVNEAKWMFFLYPVIVPAMCVGDMIKMIVIGKPAKTVTELNWETAHELRQVQRQIEQLEDQNRHDQLIADDPAAPRPHPDCGVCHTKTYPVGLSVTDYPSVFDGRYRKPSYIAPSLAKAIKDGTAVPCTADTCVYGQHTRQGSHWITVPSPGVRYDAP